MRGRAIPYGAAELAWLEANRMLPIGDYAAGFAAAFGRVVSARNLHALRKRKGWRTGRTGCFAPGIVPHNKGKPHPTRGRAAETQFKPGALSGRAARLRKPIGAERLSKDGYLERKIHDGLPMQSRWRAVHLVRWEALHGPIPKGHALKCLNGDKRDTDPANWAVVPRSMLPRLNGRHGRGFDTASPEVKPAILAITRLEDAARRVRSKRA